jgi:uncharacterized protein YcbX
MSVTLTAIYLYPVKSCRGFAVSSAQLDDWGLQFDRNWMVVTPAGKFLTQRELPQMALIETALSSEALHLKAPNQAELILPLSGNSGSALKVEVWGDRCQAVDQGEAAANWLSQALGLDCRLVRIGANYNRPVKSAANAQVSFADGYPLLLISEASLADLNQRLPESLLMNRFRPNLVVSGCDAYAEDTWQQVRINQTRFDIAKACERCVITTTDQSSGTRTSPEPLRTLATYRRVKGGGVIFGRNVIHHNRGEISVGSEVEVLNSPQSSLHV